MKPPLIPMWNNYPRSEKREPLFAELGWSDIANNPSYKDTCAIRMSIALLRCGMTIPGASMRVHAGKLKGQRIEQRQHRLSDALKFLWGQPEVYDSEKAAKDGIGSRSGVVSFFRIAGGPGGHIDLIHPGPYGFLECARSCFFGCWEIWFWPLD
jgi:hypothetical protein